MDLKKINILFLCKANCFRSKTAEAYFKKINKNKNIVIKSAGIIKGYKQVENQIKIAKNEFNLNIKGKPQSITIDLLKWSDIFIITANDIHPKMFKDEKEKGYIKKLIVWKIKDIYSKDDRGIKKSISNIIKKVDDLNKQLKELN